MKEGIYNTSEMFNISFHFLPTYFFLIFHILAEIYDTVGGNISTWNP